MRRHLLLAAAVLAMAALLWRILDVRAPAPRTPDHAPSAPSAGLDPAPDPGRPAAEPLSTSPPAPPRVVAVPTPRTQPAPGDIEFPDGTWLPPLNGVIQAPKILFHDLAPFARVTGRMRDASGRDWYVHENGVRSTTYLGPDGRAIGLVSKDMPTQPLLPDEDR